MKNESRTFIECHAKGVHINSTSIQESEQPQGNDLSKADFRIILNHKGDIDPDSRVEWIVEGNVIKVVPLPKDPVAAFRRRGSRRYSTERLVERADGEGGNCQTFVSAL